MYCDLLDLHVQTHSFPPRRSSDLIHPCRPSDTPMKTAYIDCTEYGFDIIQKHALMDRVPGMLLQVGDPDNDALHDLLNGASAIINGHTLMDDALLARCDALKTIVFLGTGASSYIDMQAAARRTIDIVPNQGYGDRTNAEHAFAM